MALHRGGSDLVRYALKHFAQDDVREAEALTINSKSSQSVSRVRTPRK
jgi:hypothetical protein